MLANIFPNNTSVGSDGIFLYMSHKEMPPKPWPKTVAGLPLYLSARPFSPPKALPRYRFVSRKNGSIADDMNGRDLDDWCPLFDIIRDHFHSLHISITEVIYCRNLVYIVLEHRSADLSKLPWQAAEIRCFYLYEDEMGRPSVSKAHLQTDPMPGNPDNSEYGTLQPGVRISSGYLQSDPGKFMSTTAGVLVKSAIGVEFMTVAAHGFPNESGVNIIHPVPTPGDGRRIGELIMEVGRTDVALVRLRDGEKFRNVTFESENITTTVPLKRLAPTEHKRFEDPVFLDSPDTGCIEGILIFAARRRIPSDDPLSPAQVWVHTR